MSRSNRRVDCPVCGARSSATSFEREGCWSCGRDKQEADIATAFEAFMAQDEEARWLKLWRAAGRPS